jgi:DNA adenine methylase
MSDEFNLLDDLLEMHADTVKEDVKRSNIERAPFGYVGSKFKSIRNLEKHLPYRKKWIDVFCGSGIVTLNRQESPIEVMNDRYGGSVAFYRCLRDKDKMQQMIEWLELTQHSREDFYHCRNTWCSEKDDVVRAAKWYYMIQSSTIASGRTFGRNTNNPGNEHRKVWPRLPLFPIIHARLRNVTLENLDFETCMSDYDDESTVFYLDPPYAGTNNVYEGSWSRDDLARLLRRVDKTRGFVALSSYADTQIDECKFWDERHTWEVPIMTETKGFVEGSCKEHLKDVKTTDYATEVLWIKH